MDWSWLPKTILWHGNTINKSLGYEIYDDEAVLRLLDACNLTEKTKNSLAISELSSK